MRTSATAALPRACPTRAWNDAILALRAGDTIDLEALRLQLADRGYHRDEHVDERDAAAAIQDAYAPASAGRRLQPATQRRLHAMETPSGLVAGVAVAAADLDLRGAGDLFGEEQVGHVRALGTGLYQHLLRIAVAKRQGWPTPPPTPVLNTRLNGRIPQAYVPEPDLRLSLYARLAQLSEPAALLTFAEELEDRFGSRPPELESLIALHRLRLACIDQGVTRLDAGRRGTALTPLGVPQAEGLSRLAEVCSGTVRDGRVLFALVVADPLARVTQLLEMLT